MKRRNLFRLALAAAAGLAAPSARAEPRGAKKVVYHLADAEKVVFALGNIQNHIEGTGGPGAIAIALVVHGRALNSFRADTHYEEIKAGVAEAAKAGVTLYACGHTMAAQKLSLSDLLPGFVVAEKGGVVALADLQAQGWAYLRP
jgi:intracellular sulfur oxidation DsrE/DsrF family protein